MLTVTSEKTSLRDLTIAELRRVAWDYIDPSEFAEDFNDLNFLARVNYAERRLLANWIDNGEILKVMDESALEFVISSRKQVSRSTFKLSGIMWDNDKQFSLEFLTTYAKYLWLDECYKQRCITPEFLDKNSRDIGFRRFFDRFSQNRDPGEIREFMIYDNGKFLRHIMDSRCLRYLTRETLIELDLPVPDYYDTVITEQRIMSGNPCDDGQRSFTIWLRKFRRVTGRMNDYPTWNEMLNLMKTHPRLNNNGYVDWIMGRCLENTEEEVSRYPERLSYEAKQIHRDTYQYITGTDDAQATEDFNVEFADVIDPPVQANADNADALERAMAEMEAVSVTPPRLVTEMREFDIDITED